MWLYILIFAVIVLLAMLAKTEEQQQSYFKYCMIFLALFVGLSDMLGGYDRYIYGECFDDAADALKSDGNIMDTGVVDLFGGEFGYCLWNFAIGYITQNRYIFILLTTLVMYFLFWRGIKNQTENPMLALVVFMALNFFFSFTYLRQMMAAAIAWQALPYVEKRDLKRFSLWVFVAFMFHHSAIVLFPFYFVPFKKMDIKWVFFAFAVCLLLGLSGISSALFEAYNSTDAMRAGMNVEDTGFRWAYFVEACFFFYFIVRHYDDLGNDSKSVIGLNMSIVFCCILLVFIKSENGGRLGWHYLIGLYSILSQILSWKNNFVNRVLVVSVCLWLYIRVLMSWGILLTPYKTFLTPGIREHDTMEILYEYDHDYDNDKFYR